MCAGAGQGAQREADGLVHQLRAAVYAGAGVAAGDGAGPCPLAGKGVPGAGGAGRGGGYGHRRSSPAASVEPVEVGVVGGSTQWQNHQPALAKPKACLACNNMFTNSHSTCSAQHIHCNCFEKLALQTDCCDALRQLTLLAGCSLRVQSSPGPACMPQGRNMLSCTCVAVLLAAIAAHASTTQ